MDPHPLLSETNLPIENSPKDLEIHSQPPIIQDNGSHSQTDDLDQMREPLLVQFVKYFLPSNPKFEEPKTVSEKKMQEIDKKLGQGWYFLYELWLSFVIVAAVSKGVFLVASVQDWWYGREYNLVKIIAVPLGLALHCSLWSVKQAWLQREAMKKKDQKKADEAYRSAMRLAIYYFIVCVMFLLVVIYWQCFDSRRRNDWIKVVCFLVVQFIMHFVIPVGISVYGSYKVKVLLEEKMDLIVRARNGDDGQSSTQMISH